MGVDELDDLLNRRSGLLGLTGRGDMRDVQAAAATGDAAARLALAVYAHRVRHYLGAYLIALGRVDAIVFTAGVGENSASTRADAVAGLEHFGILLDPHRNDSAERGERRISADGSPVEVLVIPTNEELEIARQTLALTAR
jgi:acetate kinase